VIKQVLSRYYQLDIDQPVAGIEPLIAFDEVRDQYLWFQVGWNQQKRVRGITAHLRILNGKIWIEEDWTDTGIANDLINAGISKRDIVLAFHHPEERRLTDFAIA
jgi:hypothetical protein